MAGLWQLAWDGAFSEDVLHSPIATQRPSAPDLLTFCTLLAEASEKPNTTEKPSEEESSPPDHIKAVLLGTLLLVGVIVLLLFGYIIINNRRAGGLC